MLKFRDNRELVLHAYQSNFISDEEFVLLYDINSSKNCDIPYWKYDSFDLDKMTDDECKAEFRFLKNDIYALTDILQLPDEIVCYNDTKTTSTEGLCMLLKQFAYPSRYVDMCPKFGRSIPELCLISNNVMEFIYTGWNHLLHTFVQP